MRQLVLLALLMGCGAESPCSETPSLEFGEGTVHTGFKPLSVEDGVTLVIGSQGSPMFDDLAMRAQGIPTTKTGPTRDGWDFYVNMDGNILGRAMGRLYRREEATCVTEIVDIRVIPNPTDAGILPPAMDIWNRQVTLIGTVEGEGLSASGELTLEAVRP